MSPSIDLTDDTVARLQKIATPLVDTFDSVIIRLLDAYNPGVPSQQASPVVGAKGPMTFDAASPPQLKFTTCTRITVEGQVLPKQTTFWNNLLSEVIRVVAAKGHDAPAILKMMSFANAVIGKREDSGYKFIASAGLSLQGAEAAVAFKQAYQLASANGVSFTVEFVWQANERAAYPNQAGVIEVQA